MSSSDDLDRIEKFEWTEYLVFSAVLAASLGIGIFYGCFGSKNKTNEEFLMAGRSMSVLPVTMSLLCSFVSGVTLLGNPMESYFYGTQYALVALGFVIMTVLLAYVYVPVYFDLQLTSAYEYFEWRYSRKMRIVLSVFAMTHLITYMPIAVFGPSLALEQVTGMNYQWSSAALFLVCIAYTSIGGLKAVLWTDALQAVVMFLALIMIIVLGTIKVGGLEFVWEKASETGRVIWWNFDPDPRTRHTFFTAVIGGALQYLPLFAATQSQIQRYNSVPTLRQSRNYKVGRVINGNNNQKLDGKITKYVKLIHSRKTLLFNMLGLTLVQCMCTMIGLIIYAAYYDCDPVESKAVQSPDQMTPLFVMQILGKYRGLPGLLVAGLTCGSLSSVSSALNSLAAIITEDYVKRWWPGLSEERLGSISKYLSAGTGILAFALIFVMGIINETLPILPFSTLLHGSLLGPILGAFTLGMVFPWTNDIGTFLGVILGVLLTGFVGLGSIISSNLRLLPNQRLNLTTTGCDVNATNYGLDFFNGQWKEEHSDDSFFLKVFSASYLWQPGIGAVSTFLLGLIFSFAIVCVTRKRELKPKSRVNIKLLSKPFVGLWVWIFGKDRISEWVDFEEFDFGGRQKKREDAENVAKKMATENSRNGFDVSPVRFKQFDDL